MEPAQQCLPRGLQQGEERNRGLSRGELYVAASALPLLHGARVLLPNLNSAHIETCQCYQQCCHDERKQVFHGFWPSTVLYRSQDGNPIRQTLYPVSYKARWLPKSQLPPATNAGLDFNLHHCLPYAITRVKSRAVTQSEVVVASLHSCPAGHGADHNPRAPCLSTSSSTLTSL